MDNVGGAQNTARNRSHSTKDARNGKKRLRTLMHRNAQAVCKHLQGGRQIALLLPDSPHRRVEQKISCAATCNTSCFQCLGAPVAWHLRRRNRPLQYLSGPPLRQASGASKPTSSLERRAPHGPLHRARLQLVESIVLETGDGNIVAPSVPFPEHVPYGFDAAHALAAVCDTELHWHRCRHAPGHRGPQDPVVQLEDGDAKAGRSPTHQIPPCRGFGME